MNMDGKWMENGWKMDDLGVPPMDLNPRKGGCEFLGQGMVYGISCATLVEWGTERAGTEINYAR